MRPINYLPVAIAALAFNSGSIALGALLEHKMTLALTTTEEVQNEDKVSAKTTTESSKLVKGKISNKELLEFFVRIGEIEDIKGWSIVGTSWDDDGDLNDIYLVKVDEWIYVSDYFYFEIDGGISPESYQEVTNNETESYTGSYSEFEEAYFEFEYEIEEDLYISFYLDTIANQRGDYEWDEIEDEWTSILTALNFENASGEFYDEQNEKSGIVTGSCKFGKGVPSDIND